MSKLFYPKLAIMNIKKNSETYYPFVLTCICTIMMFYIMHAISINEGLNYERGSANLKTILNLGTIVIGIFSGIFLFYTNSFLIKRRKKEIGLYNVLGLEKRHIAKVLFFESIFISCTSLVIGLISGIILNKLMFLLLLRLLHFEVSFGFSLSISSIITTLMVFIGIFSITLLSNLFQIRRLNPIDLLKGLQQGEKEAKTKWIMTIIGVIALSAGYGIALRVQSPLLALNLFFVAVILVIIGTYALFTAGSITVLKLLRRNKKFYYKTKNFISISGMLYRMKQNAAGLANICILSTAVLVMFSSTVSLYIGTDEAVRHRYPRNVIMNAWEISEYEAQRIDEILKVQVKENNINVKNMYNYWNNSLATIRKEDKLSVIEEFTYSADLCLLIAIPLADYNRLEGENIKLADDEMMVFSIGKNYGKDRMSIDDSTFRVKEELDTLIVASKRNVEIVDTYIVILNDIEDIGNHHEITYSVGFDIEGTDQEITLISSRLNQQFIENNMTVHIETSAGSRAVFLEMHGGLLFLGIFLGTLFLMATVLSIYYKQISEGYDDKERFGIMQKVGMSKSEIKKTIRSQVLMVFFLPLAFTVIHIAFAFPIITKLLAVLNLTNVALFMWSTIVTILVFAIIYAIVFCLTARAYYKIVK